MTQMCCASGTSPHPTQTTRAFPESSDSSLLITPTSAWEKLKPRSVGCPAVSSISGSSVSGYYFIPGVAFVPACHPFLDCSGLGFVLRIFPPLMNLQSALPLSYSYGTYTDLSLWLQLTLSQKVSFLPCFCDMQPSRVPHTFQSQSRALFWLVWLMLFHVRREKSL